MPDVSQPTPQGAPTPTPAAPPAPTTPPAPTPPVTPPAPVPTPPANPPVPQPTPPAQPPAPSGQPGEPKTFTPDDVNRIVTERLAKAEQSWQAKQTEQMQKLAEAFGWQDPNATPDPAKLLEQAQSQATAAQQRADNAEAKTLALAAGVKPERLDLFLRLVDVAGALKDVDRSKGDAASTALKTAVDGALTAAPEFKGAVLPGSSGGDGQGGSTPSLDEQIAAAEKNRDFRTAIALKRQKAQQGR